MGIIEKITVDDATLARLSASALRHGRTLAEEAAATLQDGLGMMTREEFLRRADDIAAMTPRDVVQTDSTILVREDRDR